MESIEVSMDEVDMFVVDEAILAMTEALIEVDASFDEVIVAIGELFRMLVEGDEVMLLH